MMSSLPAKTHCTKSKSKRDTPFNLSVWINQRNIFHHQLLNSTNHLSQKAWHCIRFQSGLSGKWTGFVEDKKETGYSIASIIYHSCVMRCITHVHEITNIIR